jgi:hypothetical protein
MAHSREDIISRWPALAEVGEPREWAAAIADAEAQVSVATWGVLYDLGCTHLAAHLIMLSHPEAIEPIVQSESVGSISRSYAVASPPAGDAALGRTPAGVEFRRLRRGVDPLSGVMVV